MRPDDTAFSSWFSEIHPRDCQQSCQQSCPLLRPGHQRHTELPGATRCDAGCEHERQRVLGAQSSGDTFNGAPRLHLFPEPIFTMMCQVATQLQCFWSCTSSWTRAHIRLRYWDAGMDVYLDRTFPITPMAGRHIHQLRIGVPFHIANRTSSAAILHRFMRTYMKRQPCWIVRDDTKSIT